MLRSQAWTWGYVISGAIPGEVPFVGKSGCSLETAAAYLGTPNVVFMNGMHALDALQPAMLERLTGLPAGGLRVDAQCLRRIRPAGRRTIAAVPVHHGRFD